MTNRKKLNIGLFGFGCVGQGLYNVLKNSTGIKADIKKICVKDPSKDRLLDRSLFTFDKNEILWDPDINLVVELINHAGEAFDIVKSALLNGKNVVTANKKMIAEHFHELVALQEQTGNFVLYEASACGSIPIIRTLEEYYDNETLNSVSGIFNGTTNFILTKIFNENIDYKTALAKAQELGFAEVDPTLDVDGFDAKFKLQIVAGHSYGIFSRPEEVLNFGIRYIRPEDFTLARELKAKIKLIAHAGKVNEEEVSLYVIPQLIQDDHLLYNVEQEYNGVIVEASFSDKQLFIGKGAGGNPTGSAVLSDISAGSYEYRYEYKKTSQRQYRFTNKACVNVLLSGNWISEIPLKAVAVQKLNEDTILAHISIEELIAAKPLLESRQVFVVQIQDEELLEKVKLLSEKEATLV